MAYSTMLVHIETEAETAGLLQAATGLAKTFASHLTGLHISPRVHVPALVRGDVLDGILADQRRTAAGVAERLSVAFQHAATVAGVKSEWRVDEVLYQAASDVALHHTRAAELVILGQPDPEKPALERVDIAEDIILGAGRPVLLIPVQPPPPRIGGRVLVAWNDSRESARAVFDALPLLQRADSVHVLCDGPVAGSAKSAAKPAAAIVTALARSGIACTVTVLEQPPPDITATLLEHAARLGSDLIVMGSYGHSRLREYVFGGATRGMLQRMTVPVLMSH